MWTWALRMVCFIWGGLLPEVSIWRVVRVRVCRWLREYGAEPSVGSDSGASQWGGLGSDTVEGGRQDGRTRGVGSCRDGEVARRGR